MVKMLDIIQQAKDSDPNGRNAEAWKEAFNKVVEIGVQAADQTSFFRDKKNTQAFYNSFIGVKNIDDATSPDESDEESESDQLGM